MTECAPFEAHSVTVDAVSWAPVEPPADFDHVVITNAGANDTLRMRRDPAIANEYQIQPLPADLPANMID